MKHAQMVSDVLNSTMQKSRLMQTSSSQQKQTQMKFREEFSNTVVCLEGLDIAVNYLFLLGKKFRLYVSDLGNTSVHGLVIFIILTVFNDFQQLNLSRYKAVRSPVSPRNPGRPQGPVQMIIRHRQRIE